MHYFYLQEIPKKPPRKRKPTQNPSQIADALHGVDALTQSTHALQDNTEFPAQVVNSSFDSKASGSPSSSILEKKEIGTESSIALDQSHVGLDPECDNQNKTLSYGIEQSDDSKTTDGSLEMRPSHRGEDQELASGGDTSTLCHFKF